MKHIDPWVTISSRVTLKNAPRTYRGLCSENWNFKDSSSPDPSILMYKFVSYYFDFFANTTGASVDFVNEEVVKLAKWLADLKFATVETKEDK